MAKKTQSKTSESTADASADANADASRFEELRDSAHKVWLAGLGVLATAEREGSRVFQKFVEAGEELEGRGKERIRKVREDASDRFGRVTEKLGGTAEEQVAKTLERLGVPNRDEIRDLTKKIERLTAKVEALGSERRQG